MTTQCAYAYPSRQGKGGRRRLTLRIKPGSESPKIVPGKRYWLWRAFAGLNADRMGQRLMHTGAVYFCANLRCDKGNPCTKGRFSSTIRPQRRRTEGRLSKKEASRDQRGIEALVIGPPECDLARRITLTRWRKRQVTKPPPG